MRIRQVRQEFWTDEKLAALPDAVRLYYIGLWGIADDEGWFRYDVAKIGALLYPYRGRALRERNVRQWTDALAELGRVKLIDCGCGEIPTLRRHQVVGGKRSRTELDRHHREHAVQIVPDNPGSPGQSFSNGRVGNGTERNGTVGRNPELLEAFRRRGMPVDVPSRSE